jgi:hypothetical protein
VLQPVVCLAVGNEITVLDGKKRIGAAGDAGISPVPVIIIPSGDYNPHEVIQCVNPSHENEINFVMSFMNNHGCKIKDIQEALGCTPAVAAAWHRLKRLIPALVYRYRKGDMSRTTALQCSQYGLQIQTMIAANEGEITEEKIDAVLAHWEREVDSGQLVLEEAPPVGSST